MEDVGSSNAVTASGCTEGMLIALLNYAHAERGGNEVCMGGPLREVVSTSEEKEEAAGGGGAQKRKKPEGCLVLVQRYEPRLLQGSANWKV